MILLEKKRIDRTLKRMSYQILEEAREASVCLAGINYRGNAVAKMIKSHLDSILKTDVPLCQITEDHDEPVEFENPPTDKQILVIIDDVIFSGKTIFNSFNKIPELSSFQKICICVLADRGHRKFPVLASIVGLHVPTKLNEHVELQLDGDEPSQLVLIKK